MHTLLTRLKTQVCLTRDIGCDVPELPTEHGYPKTAAHCGRVADEARRIAALASADEALAEQAGWLHDVSAVFPSAERAHIARWLGLDVLPEEEAFPFIIHQKLSVVLARDLFGIGNAAVLSAVGCHTTLKANAALLDKVLFVADKLEWDQAGATPYRAGLLAALDESLDQAARFFLRYLWERRETLKVVHPWCREAYAEASAVEPRR